MRTTITILILIGLIALGLRLKLPNLPPYAGPRASRERSLAPSSDSRRPTWTLEGRWMKTHEDAEQDALLEAQLRVSTYLRSLQPPVEFLPPLDYLDKHLVKKKTEEVKDFEEQVGIMRRVQLEVEVSPGAARELVRMDRADRSHQRMFWLAKLLAGVVAALAAVSGYVHLDERTKGYYTTWLRLAAATVVGTAGIALWWLC